MRLAEFILSNKKPITKEWEEFARERCPPALRLSKLVLRDHIDDILAAVVGDMRKSVGSGDLSEGEQAREGPIDRAAKNHADQRVAVGFELDHVASEFRALRASIVRLWQASSPASVESNLTDLIRFNAAVDQVLIESMNNYTKKLDRYRDQFLAILGHDLRNPLGAILMAASVIRGQEGVEDRVASVARRILSSGQRMARLIDDLLDLTRSRLGAGLPITRGPVDFERVCRQVVDELLVIHPSRTVQLESSGDLQGEWDGDRLAQVVSNLVANAIQHGNDESPIVVSVRSDGDDVSLEVHNEGSPIPPEELGVIFEPLVRSSSADQESSPTNLGLGLFIVREVVWAHGGEVSVTSSQEEGTTFTVRLPRVPTENNGSSSLPGC